MFGIYIYSNMIKNVTLPRYYRNIVHIYYLYVDIGFCICVSRFLFFLFVLGFHIFVSKLLTERINII